MGLLNLAGVKGTAMVLGSQSPAVVLGSQSLAMDKRLHVVAVV